MTKTTCESLIGFMKLSFLIVGTMKSGTSTLADLLNQSQNIYLPEDELHFFNNKYGFGFDWYENELNKDIPLFKKKESLLIGEKTPTYSYKKECAQKIFNYSKDLKLIWIFRDPVKRAFSNYLHAVKAGNEIRSFEYSIKHEEKRIKKNIFKGYIERSKYIYQVKRFLEFFEISQMHFILFEDLISNQERVLSETMKFLECENDLISKKLPHSNKTILPKYPLIRFGSVKLFGTNSLPTKAIHKINLTLNKLSPNKKLQLDKNLEKDLRNYFLPFNKDLSKLTKLDLSIWS